MVETPGEADESTTAFAYDCKGNLTDAWDTAAIRWAHRSGWVPPLEGEQGASGRPGA